MRIRAHYYAYSKFKCPRQPLRPLSGIYLGVTRAVWDTHFFVKLVYMHAREKKIVAFQKNYRFHREKNARTVDEIDKFSIPSYFYVKRFLGTESNFVNFCQLLFEQRN